MGKIVPAYRRINPCAGATWEHEFNGKVRGSVNGVAIDSPSLCGSTGMGEFGFGYKHSRALPFDVGAQGHVGRSEGITGSTQVRVAF